MRSARIIFVSAFAFLLVLPAIQRVVRILPSTTLGGVETPLAWPRGSLSGWLDGTLQPAFEQKFNERLAVRPHLIKSWNQLHYSLFGSLPPRAGGTSIVIGPDGTLFEQPYLRSYNRQNRDREENLHAKTAQVRRFQDALRARGIAFLLVVAPSKVEIYPELVPPQLLEPGRPARKSAYDRMLPLLLNEGVNLLDAHSWFLEMKPTAPHPLFAKTGTHWNYYSAALVAGRMLKELERQTGRNFPDIAVDRVDVDRRPEGQDADLFVLLNLWGWPSLWHTNTFSGRQVHPVLSTDADAAAIRPNLLVIGDSFCLTLNEIMDRQTACGPRDTLYYFNRTFRYTPSSPGEAPAENPTGMPIDRHTFDPEQAIAGRDAVVIVVSEVKLNDIGFGFIEAFLDKAVLPPSL